MTGSCVLYDMDHFLLKALSGLYLWILMTSTLCSFSKLILRWQGHRMYPEKSPSRVKGGKTLPPLKTRSASSAWVYYDNLLVQLLSDVTLPVCKSVHLRLRTVMMDCLMNLGTSFKVWLNIFIVYLDIRLRTSPKKSRIFTKLPESGDDSDNVPAVWVFASYFYVPAEYIPLVLAFLQLPANHRKSHLFNVLKNHPWLLREFVLFLCYSHCSILSIYFRPTKPSGKAKPKSSNPFVSVHVKYIILSFIYFPYSDASAEEDDNENPGLRDSRSSSDEEWVFVIIILDLFLIFLLFLENRLLIKGMPV